MYISSTNSHFIKLTPGKKISWGMHATSQAHAVLAVVLAIPIFFAKELQSDPLFGYNRINN
jgi:hypothetical protein